KDGKVQMPQTPHFNCVEFTGMELLTAADYLITDYSAIAVEAALLQVPTLYYVHDYEDYVETNGLNLDLFAEMPGCVHHEAEDVIRVIHEGYPLEALNEYRKKYVFQEPGRSTERLV